MPMGLFDHGPELGRDTLHFDAHPFLVPPDETAGDAVVVPVSAE